MVSHRAKKERPLKRGSAGESPPPPRYILCSVLGEVTQHNLKDTAFFSLNSAPLMQIHNFQGWCIRGRLALTIWVLGCVTIYWIRPHTSSPPWYYSLRFCINPCTKEKKEKCDNVARLRWRNFQERWRDPALCIIRLRFLLIFLNLNLVLSLYCFFHLSLGDYTVSPTICLLPLCTI